jgi:fructose/tagatose bisphosphate aldolase
MEHRIVIHCLADARAALEAAVQAGKPVVLASAPRAAAYLGAAVFREIINAAARAVPSATYSAVLDCGDDAGAALNALRHGIKMIRLDADEHVTRRVADIAAQYGAALDAGPAEALDLATVSDPPRACRAWLTSRTTKRGRR